MTEAEWLACNTRKVMLDYLKDKSTPRKAWLFIAACNRLNWQHYDEDYRQLTVMEEQYADGLASKAEYFSILHKIGLFEEHVEIDPLTWAQHFAHFAVRYGAYVLVESGNNKGTAKWDETAENAWQAAYAAIEATQCHLLREIVGNPFRPVAVERSWLQPDVLLLAEGIYRERTFEIMPILGDALEEAGCDNVVVLAHCRQTEPHVLGCWLLDMILGKQ